MNATELSSCSGVSYDIDLHALMLGDCACILIQAQNQFASEILPGCTFL